MPIESSGEIRLRGTAGDGRTDINEEINSNATDTDVSLGTLNTSAFTNVSDGSTISGRSMSEMRGFALVTADPFYPTTEATGALGESLLFGGTNEYIRKTNSISGNSKILTLSFWTKIEKIDTAYKTIISSGTGGTARSYFFFYNNIFHIYEYNGSSYTLQIETPPIIDTAGWYHIIIAIDTTKSYTNDRTRVYINGIEIDVTRTTSYSQNADSYLLRNNTVAIGYDYGLGSRFFPGTIADFKAIDGQQLRPDSFGEIKNGIWVPKAFNVPSTDTLVTSNTILSWDFANGTAEDLSANNNDGLISGAPFLKNNYGVFNFDGSVDRISIGSLTGIGTHLPFSITGWFYNDSSSNGLDAVTAWSTTGTLAANFVLGRSSSGTWQYRLGHANSNELKVVMSNDYELNKWIHVAFTYDGSKSTNGVKLYLNNIEASVANIADNNLSTSTTFPNFAIGYGAWAGTYYDGKIGNVQLYSAALTEAQITQNYNATKHKYAYGLNGFHLPLNNTSAGIIVDDTSLKLHLDASNSSSYGGSGTTWSDLTTNNNDATLSGLSYLPSTNGGIFDFDNNTDYIQINNELLPATANFTIDFWIYRDSSSDADLFNQATSSGDIRTYFKLDSNGTFRVFSAGTNSSRIQVSNTSSAIVNGKWNHVSIIRNGSSMTFYINTKPETETISGGTIGVGRGDLIIGSASVAPDAKLAQVRVYNKALTAQEVIQNYRATQGNYEQVSTVDISGNANNFIATNLDYTDHIKDQPAENYAAFDPGNIIYGSATITLSEGNRKVSISSGSEMVRANIGVNAGKWYWEMIGSNLRNGTTGGRFGITTIQKLNQTNVENADFHVFWHPGGNLYRIVNGSYVTPHIATGTQYYDNDVLAIALDCDNQEINFYKNNTLAYTYDYSSNVDAGHLLTAEAHNSSSGTPVYNYNFGQKAFTYTPPTGYKALATHNLPNAQFDPQDSEQNKDYFKAVIYQGNGGTQGEAYGIVDGSNAGVFNGSSSRINIGSSNNFQGTEFSISLWINYNTVNGNPIVSNYNGGSYATGDFYLNYNSTGFMVQCYDGSGFQYRSPISISANTWYNVVYVKTNDTTGGKFYVNGSEVSGSIINGSSSGGTILNTSDNFYIGNHLTNTDAINGKIDQVRIFNKAISASEVSDLYDEQDLTATTRSTTDIFNDGSGVALYELNGDALDTGGVSGKFGSGAIFNGSSSQISLPDNISGSGVYTISMWAKVPNIASSTPYNLFNFGKYDGEAFTQNGNLYFRDYNSSGTQLFFINATGQTSIATEYTHLIFVYDGSNAYIYKNGSQIATGSASSGTRDITQNYIGCRSYLGSTSNFLNGQIDQVRIFNKALSTNNNGVNEINELYTESGADLSTTDILGDGSAVALYQLDGDATDTGGVSGKFGSAAIFNGSSSYIDLNSSILGVTTTFSINCWVKSTNTTQDSFIVASNNGGTGWYQIVTDGVANKVDAYRGSLVNFGTMTDIFDGNWKMLTMTFDNNTIKTYLNGSFVAQGTGSAVPSNPTDMIIGARNTSTISGFFDGSIDDVRIYSDVLTLTEVGYLYNNTIASIPTSNLVAHYKLDGNALDSAGSYNGTATNVIYKYDGTETNISYAYNGTASNVTYTQDKPYGNIDVGFKPDLVWLKGRDTNNHQLYDSVRGGNLALTPNLTESEYNNGSNGLVFDSNGFTINNGYGNHNGSGKNYIAWCWKAAGFKNDFNVIENSTLTTSNSNTTAGITAGSITNGWNVSANRDTGFSIVKYTGTGSTASVGHGLSSAPEMIIIKSLGVEDWFVYFGSTSTPADYVKLNSTTFAGATSAIFSSPPTSTVFNQGGGTGVGANNVEHIAYCFHSVNGFSKIGSYIGNGSSDGPFVYTGFKPAFVLIKNTDNDYNWYIRDNVRNTSNPVDSTLAPNTSSAEDNGWSDGFDFLSNGFKINLSSVETNQNGNTFIYMAFAEDPFTTSNAVATLGDGNEFIEGGNYPEDNFAATLYTGNSGTQKIVTGIDADLVWIKARTDVRTHSLLDTVRGGSKILQSESTAVEWDGSAYFESFDSNGFTVKSTENFINNSSHNYVAWSWKAAGNENTYNILENGTVTSSASASTLGLTNGTITPDGISANKDNGFSIIKYSGNSTAGATVPHGLNKPPQIIIVKKLDGAVDNWAVYNETIGNTKRLALDENTAVASNRLEWNSTSPTSTVFTLGNHSAVNQSSSYIAYAWHSVPGFSKIGSYVGNGSSSGPTVHLGFEPKFLLIKSTEARSWRIVDTSRSQSNPVTKDLRADSNTTENDWASYGWGNIMNINSDGFEIITSDNQYNTNSATYIYMAFAHR